MLFVLSVYNTSGTSTGGSMMTEAKHVKKWLTDYKSMVSADIPAYAKKISSDDQLITGIFRLLEQGNNERLAPVYSQLFEFYKSNVLELQRFTLQFIPVIIFQYLKYSFTRMECGPMEALLLGIFNLEALEMDGTSRTECVRIPSLGKPSIYHEPSIQLAISDSLNLHQESEHRIVTRAPLPEVESIKSHNRICQSGFSCQTKDTQDRIGGDLKLKISSREPRIPLNSEFLSEMVHCLYYIIFNKYASAGQEALQAVHFRAQHEMFAEVLLVTGAIKHSLDTNPSGRPQDGPVGINISLTPPSPVVKKAPVTGASFKSSKNREITTITVTIESVTTTPITNGSSRDHVDTAATTHVKHADNMHRLAVSNNQRHRNQGKGHGNSQMAERKVGASNNAELKSSTVIHTVHKNGKDKQISKESNVINKNLVPKASKENDGLDILDDKTKVKMKENLELNLSTVETSF
ncbi:hypothetical protein HOLleu_40995 [Holothuria leucospilota]|uniref:Hyccin n=1 Tax=Holothuria leucospilota TaxID=206669 RepID=A0A9Q1BBU2_HOLLE|nr:hypothetical protein HOLleu_40995 [Holothuria leucospilota]